MLGDVGDIKRSTAGTYLYNGLEQRVAKTVASTTTQYVLDDDGHVLSENDASGNPIREYIWLDGMPVALVDHTGMSPVLYFIQTDHLNRPQKLTDGSAALVWDAVYLPFGEIYLVSGTATNLLMFPGQFYDAETALAQNWHRDYDATLGRYIESDPIGLAGGIDTYAYVGGNPLGDIDPAGLFPWKQPARQNHLAVAALDRVLCPPNGADAFNDLRHQLADQNAIELGKLLNPIQGLVDCVTKGCSLTEGALAGAAVVPFGKFAQPLKWMHSEALIRSTASYLHWSAKQTDEIVRSLQPGLKEALKVGPDGKIWDGNTRTLILQERGYPVNTLPRDSYSPSSLRP